MTAPLDPATDAAGLLRREALGAFAHEIRTPLTSIRMVLELAARLGTDGKNVLDAELAAMLDASVDDLERLADELQEFSRLERGRMVLSGGPSELGVAVETARALVAPDLALEGASLPDGLVGSWDAGHLARAIASFGHAANRMGSGSGSVGLAMAETPGGVELRFESGRAGGPERAIGVDAGFSFFWSWQCILAMGGSVGCLRSERYVEITVGLPFISIYAG